MGLGGGGRVVGGYSIKGAGDIECGGSLKNYQQLDPLLEVVHILILLSAPTPRVLKPILGCNTHVHIYINLYVHMLIHAYVILYPGAITYIQQVNYIQFK